MIRIIFRKLTAIALAIILLSSCNDRSGSSSYSNSSAVDSNDYVVETPPYSYAPQQQANEQEEDYELPDLAEPSYSYGYGGEDEMSDEGRYFAQFSNFEPSSSDKKGVVVYEGQGDYYIIETTSGYIIAERYSGMLYEDHTIYGPLHSYGFKYCIDLNRDSEVKLYIEDYMLSQDRAIEWMGEHNHLKYYDQSRYDEANNDW